MPPHWSTAVLVYLHCVCTVVHCSDNLAVLPCEADCLEGQDGLARPKRKSGSLSELGLAGTFLPSCTVFSCVSYLNVLIWPEHGILNPLS